MELLCSHTSWSRGICMVVELLCSTTRLLIGFPLVINLLCAIIEWNRAIPMELCFFCWIKLGSTRCLELHMVVQLLCSTTRWCWEAEEFLCWSSYYTLLLNGVGKLRNSIVVEPRHIGLPVVVEPRRIGLPMGRWEERDLLCSITRWSIGIPVMVVVLCSTTRWSQEAEKFLAGGCGALTVHY